MYPEAARSAHWLKHGWHVAVAYVVGFFVMLAVLGWHPGPLRNALAGSEPATSAP